MPIYYFTGRYIVKPGDTLYSIARTSNPFGGFPVSSVLILNPQLKPPYIIYPGQQIFRPWGGPYTNRIVKAGDTLYSIIRDFNRLLEIEGNIERITLNEVLAINPRITNPNILYPGMSIVFPDIG
ncbi:MAG TPA: LysM peptidoglycan-binding domain-containing protein [Pseudobacteroides sp.]|nr:LysM peptidoglycan-binding domain-containing protein [Pseudobacteroides sp.]